MTGDVSFVLAEKENALYLPTKFIKDKTVTVMKNGKREKVKVETEMEAEGVIEITKGLDENEIVYE